jgi:hypothetical protein
VVIWNMPKLAECTFLEHWQDRWNQGKFPFQLGVASENGKNRTLSRLQRS